MQKRVAREIIRVPTKYREKFLVALIDEHLKSFTDQQKIEYANRAIRYDRLNEIRIYEPDGIVNELSKHCPNLVDEWNDTVKNHGEKC
jgi:hypothetical protein